MPALIDARRASTIERLDELRGKLDRAAGIASARACVYLTGSFARGEASEHSDLDLFIVGRGKATSRELSNLDEVCIKAQLIEVTRTLKIPDFSGDGEYLTHYTIDELVGKLGTANDDATNTFTARLLLLLESQPLIGDATYSDTIDGVLAAYWRDYEDHSTEFMPAFLANDILRLWRTFCVNYEARTKTDPPEKKAKRKLKNYKLKHSRLLTCYSALACLLALYKSAGTVSPDDARDLVKRTPTMRLEWLRDLDATLAPRIDPLLEMYAEFLRSTDQPEDKLVDRFLDPSFSKEQIKAASKFGDEMYLLIDSIGRAGGGAPNPFYRLLVV